MTMTPERPETPRTAWRDIVARYQTPSVRGSVFQLCTTIIPLLGTLYLMYLSMDVSYWLVLGLALPAAGFTVRAFIIMHDCGHGSFFRSRRANDIVGFITGALTLTPYAQWRREHAIHHANSGLFEGRGVGDITTLTVREYLALPRWRKFKYRLYRHPLVLFGIGPLWLAIKQRAGALAPNTGKKEFASIHATNLTLLALLAALSLWIGMRDLVLLYLPVLMISGGAGIWLFYVQHQYEEAYWQAKPHWDYAEAAIRGSSYLKLPRVLQWFTGNIGLHHVHHLSPKIPNYRLQRCHDENPIFHSVTTLTLWQSLKTIKLKLWDEEQGRMVGYRRLREVRCQPSSASPTT